LCQLLRGDLWSLTWISVSETSLSALAVSVLYIPDIVDGLALELWPCSSVPQNHDFDQEIVVSGRVVVLETTGSVRETMELEFELSSELTKTMVFEFHLWR
jgi:hypothetical protein